MEEIAITWEQLQKEQETNVPLSTHHRFKTKQDAISFLFTVEDLDIVHLWDFGTYVKVCIVHKGAIANFRNQ